MGELASKSLADGTMEQCSGSCISLLAQGTHLASRFVAWILTRLKGWNVEKNG